MRGHITSHEMHLAAVGDIEAGALLEISRHLDTCALCAGRAEELVDVDALVATMRDAISADEHPEMAELTAYAEDEIEASAREWVEAHLESCVRCREDVADIRAEQASVGSGWRAWQLLAAGILIAAAIGAGTLWLRSRSSSPVSPPGMNTHSVPHAASAPRSDPWVDLERAVLAAGTIEPPAILHALRPEAQTLRGGGTASDAELRPVGEVIENDRPLFTWKATPGASYIVMIFAGAATVDSSGPINAPQWRPAHPLKRGTTYYWQVETGRADGSSTIAPTPPQPEAFFRTADASTLADIAAARRAHPDDHLLLAILYARAGMKTPALAELDTHLASHPADVRASALADGIRHW